MAATRIAMQWFGTRALNARLLGAAAGAPKALATTLFLEAHRILARSIRITPRDTGALRSTGHVEPPKVTSRGAEVVLGYGGPAAPYAVYVHEITTSYHEPPTQAKYLEQPVLEATRGLSQRLGLSLKLVGF